MRVSNANGLLIFVGVIIQLEWGYPKGDRIRYELVYIILYTLRFIVGGIDGQLYTY